MNYGKAIKIARSTKGLSQKDLGKLIDVNPSYISRLEAGERLPSTETLEAISKALSVPMYLLMLLGSDVEDLKGISTEQAAILGQNLLDIVINVPQSIKG